MSVPGTSRTSRNVRLESAKWGKADIDQVARRFALRCGPRALDANVIVSLDCGSTGAPTWRDVNRKLAHLSSRATMSKLGAVQGVP
jgi:formylmethanofuran dehydrogenase subunit D